MGLNRDFNKKVKSLDLIQVMPIMISVALLGIAICMTLALWGLVFSKGLMVWFLCVFWLLGARLYLCKKPNKTSNKNDWIHNFEILLLIVWGGLPLFFWPQGALVVQTIMALGLFFVAVLIRISNPSLSNLYIVGFTFAIPVVLLFLQRSNLAPIIAIILVMFGVIAALVEKYIRYLIGINFEQECQLRMLLEQNELEQKEIVHPGGPDIMDLKTHSNVSMPTNKLIDSTKKNPKRVLVVEDNIINQQVVMELLQELEVQVSLASNGQKALDMVVQESFDLILMDIQMPEMDGYEATHRIRQLEQFENLPIVAMTAYAMQEDRSRCLAAGMNDHVAKPFEPDTFYQTICLWLKLPKYNLTETAKITAGLNTNLDVIPELNGIEGDTGLKKVLYNQSLYLKLLSEFYQDFYLTLNHLDEYLNTEQFESAARLLHRIKGASGNIGAMNLYASSKDLELTISNNSVDENGLAVFKKSYTELMEGLAQLSNQNQQDKFIPKPEGGIDMDALGPLLNELTQYIHDASPQAVDLLPNIRNAARGNLNELFGALTEHIYTFQFEDAAVTLEQIKQKIKQMGTASGQ